VLLCWCAFAWADAQTVRVAGAYVDLYTGPGRGYPIFHVAERGETLVVHKRRTNWYRIETETGRVGWLPFDQLARTVNLDGSPLDLPASGVELFQARRWEMGFSVGDFEGADLLGGFFAWHGTRNLSVQLSAGQALGEFSDSLLADLSVVHQPFPDWRLAPYFRLGTGVIDTSPSATLVSTEDRLDQTAVVAAGLRYYLARRFVIRAEYTNHLILTSRDENQEIAAWQLALCAFF
jgi:uncharacterized protein YgiM (DUF1202 family)